MNIKPQVRRLILEGLEEHWGTLDSRLNSDLEDIGTSYARGTVLVARDAERIVGVGAIVPVAADEGEVKRMSVARGARRQGIGTALLVELVADAKKRGWGSGELCERWGGMRAGPGLLNTAAATTTIPSLPATTMSVVARGITCAVNELGLGTTRIGSG